MPPRHDVPQGLAEGLFAVGAGGNFTVVRRSDGTPMPNALLNAGGGHSTRTDTNGAYRLALPPGWGGTVTPENAGWIFTPTNRAYAELATDLSGEDFTGALAEPMTLTATRSANTLNLRWPSAVGLQYQLQSATNLPATTWFDEGAPFPGTGGVLTTNLPTGPEPSKFFRLLTP